MSSDYSFLNIYKSYNKKNIKKEGAVIKKKKRKKKEI